MGSSIKSFIELASSSNGAKIGANKSPEGRYVSSLFINVNANSNDIGTKPNYVYSNVSNLVPRKYKPQALMQHMGFDSPVRNYSNDIIRSSSMSAFYPAKSTERSKYSPYDNVSKENLSDTNTFRIKNIQKTSSFIVSDPFVPEPDRKCDANTILYKDVDSGIRVPSADDTSTLLYSKENSYYDIPNQVSCATIVLSMPTNQNQANLHKTHRFETIPIEDMTNKKPMEQRKCIRSKSLLGNINSHREHSKSHENLFSDSNKHKGALKKTDFMSERNFQRASLTVRWKDVIDSSHKKTPEDFSLSQSGLNFEKFFDKIDQLIARLRNDYSLASRDFTCDLYQNINDEIRFILLTELNSSIECLRLKSSKISDEILIDKQMQCEKSTRDVASDNMEIKKTCVADICKHFINDTKLLISAILLDQQLSKKDYVFNSIISYCDFLKHILDLSYVYLYKCYKLKEMKQVLHQLLKLTNSFCHIINLSYLNIVKHNVNLDLIVSESNGLTHEIGWIIQLFKVLF